MFNRGLLTSITFTDLSFAFNISMHFLGFVLVFDGLIRMIKVIKKE